MDDIDQCWLYEWIDEFEILSDADIERSLASGTALKRLHEIAAKHTHTDDFVRGNEWSDSTLLAGEGLNLAGETTCRGYDCQVSELDHAISKAWHFFDRIVVTGPSAGDIAVALEDTPRRDLFDLHFDIAQDVKLLNYIRNVGASRRIAFRDNNWVHCTSCVKKETAELGLTAAIEKSTKAGVVDQIKREANITIKREDKWIAYTRHPLLRSLMVYTFPKKPTKEAVAQRVFSALNRAAVIDYSRAHRLGLPLATTVEASWLNATGHRGTNAIEERMGRVALKLDLPTMSGMGTRDLLLFLEDQRPYFVRFQSALRAAIYENVKKLDSKSDNEIAKAVMRDYIEPELEDIYRRLSTTSKNFSKKLASATAIGTATTSIGLIGSMPLIIGTGVAAAATIVPQLYKYFDDRSSVRMSDMYFLWKINGRRHH